VEEFVEQFKENLERKAGSSETKEVTVYSSMELYLYHFLASQVLLPEDSRDKEINLSFWY
jgi:hypothetical protein